MDPFLTFDKGHKIRLVSFVSRYRGGDMDQDKNYCQSMSTELILSKDGVFTLKESPFSISVEISDRIFKNDGKWEVSDIDEQHTTLKLFFRDGRQLSYQIVQDEKGYLFLDGKRYISEKI